MNALACALLLALAPAETDAFETAVKNGARAEVVFRRTRIPVSGPARFVVEKAR